MSALLPPVLPLQRAETLTDRAYAALRRALMAGQFRPGQKITIRGLAADLGVSATPAKEAMGRLIAERALESGPQRSAIVPKLDGARVKELYFIRIALEGVVAERAAGRIAAAEFARLESVQKALTEAMDRHEYRVVLERNEDFHFTIYRAAGLPAAEHVIQNLWLQLGPSLNLLYPAYDASRRGVAHHRAALAALRTRDGKALRQAIEADARDGCAQLCKALETARD